jgi:hypothetical protein
MMPRRCSKWIEDSKLKIKTVHWASAKLFGPVLHQDYFGNAEAQPGYKTDGYSSEIFQYYSGITYPIPQAL